MKTAIFATIAGLTFAQEDPDADKIAPMEFATC